jgi:Tol biopolymer transport system component
VRRPTLALALLAAAWATQGFADQQIADIRQGTNLALTLAPDGQTLVVELVGQLWRLPASGGGATPLTPAGEDARNPRYSPDGRQIVYQRFDAGQWDLWLLDLDGGEPKQLTATPDNERQPDFGADGRSVVFASDRTGHYCLWSVELATGVSTQLTEEPGDAAFPAVSSLGQIAYVLERDGQSALKVLLGGTSTAVASSAEPLSAPSWRPGGGVLVYTEQDALGSSHLEMAVLSDPPVFKPLSGNEDIFRNRPAWTSPAEFIYAADGQIWRRGIAPAPRRPVHLFAALAVEQYQPPADMPPLDAPDVRTPLGIGPITRSADGRRTAFTALGDLWLVERGDLRRLTDDAFVELDPALAPDGSAVVFASDRAGTFALWRLTLASRDLTRLTTGNGKPYAPAFSPDGKRLAYLETTSFGPWGPATLRVLDLAPQGSPVTVAEGLVDAGRPVWSATDDALSIAANGGRDLDQGAASVAVDIEPSRRAVAALPADKPVPPFSVPRELQWQVAQGPTTEYVVQVGRLFDGISGDYRRHVDIHVAGNRIRAIVGRDVLPLPATVIDARDATVIPGLIDVHVHESALAGERLGRAWLAYGVTTVREISTDIAASLELGEAWASGRRPGPRLVISPAEGAPPPTAAMLGSQAVPVRDYPGLADGLAHSLPRQARELEFPALHPTFTERPTLGTGGRHYELEVSPQNQSYQDIFSRVIQSLTVMTPALGALEGWRASGSAAIRLPSRDRAYERLFDATERAAWDRAAPTADAVPALQETIARLVRGGGRVAVGTDAPAVPYGAGVHLELALLAAAGIPNDQVLRLATAEGALALGLERQLGTLEEGKLADFVVINGDPLTRIADTGNITAVVKGGRWLDRASLLDSP